MRIIFILLIINLGLPVACINTCGGGSGGVEVQVEMSGQEIENYDISVFEETSSVKFSFYIRYLGETIAMLEKKGGFGAYACSPPQYEYINQIINISITSNSELYDLNAGEELSHFFLYSKYGDNQILEYPIQLYQYEGISLTMVGPVPLEMDHRITVKSTTSDGLIFETSFVVSFE